MGRLKLEQLYEEEGLRDYILRDINDLRKIHDIKLELVEGYNKLCINDKKMFNKFIVNYYNSHDVKERWIIPIKLFKVLEEDYIKDNKGGDILVKRVTYMLGGYNERKIFNIWKKENSENMFNRLGRVRSCIIVKLIDNGKEGWIHVGESSGY